MKDIESRVQELELHQAVSKEVLRRMENDLREIAKSSQAIQAVVTRWKGALVLLILLLSGLLSSLSGVVDRLFSHK